MLYNVVLVSVVQQSESAIRTHISPYLLPLVSPSLPPSLSHPSRGDTKHQADLPVLCGCFEVVTGSDPDVRPTCGEHTVPRISSEQGCLLLEAPASSSLRTGFC